MAALRSRANPLLSSVPVFFTRRRFGFRSICAGRLGFVSSSPSDLEVPVAGRKVLEKFTEEFEIGSSIVTFETGELARFANGSVVMNVEKTQLLSTVVSAEGDGVRDFLPLTVDYQEKQYAQGLIPTTFTRREGAPKERELLCGRLIDRPIRPLFPAGFYNDVQVVANVLSSDGKQDPGVMAANATSAALMLSDIPWGGPIGVIQIGRIGGQFVINPSMDELSFSDLNLVYACTRDKTLMIDVQASAISERDLEAALRLAHPEAVKYLEPQIRLAAKAGKQKKEYKLYMISDTTMEKIKSLAEAPIESVFTDPSYGKFDRGKALDKITQDVKKVLQEECDEESLKVLPKTIDTIRKKIVRKRIIEKGLRVDGRRLDEVRPLCCKSGNLHIPHGSSFFSRGDTQVLCYVTIGAPGDAQRLDSLVGPPRKRFMLHYNFPSFSINEIAKRGGLNRREVGHGTLAEKALLAVLPPEDNFPYTIRVNSDVMASDGSTSMATVCGGSMALMDAGIPLREHVAGVSVGLVSDVDPSTGMIKEYRILTDILGLEDHLGDMDFKIAGTRKGVTAVQLDIKPAGIPLDIICECLEPALKGRLQILDHMEQEINAPRTQDDRSSPRLATLKFSNDSLRRLIGPQGAQRRKIEEETGARISVSDGTLTIIAKNQIAMEKALDKVDFIIGREIEVGGIYKGVVSSIKEYGAFVEFNGGQQGLLHVSELSHEQVSRVSDVVSVGQLLSLMCIGQDVRGNIKLSLKATLPLPKTNNVVLESCASPVKQALNVWDSVGGMSSSQENQDSTSKKSLVGKADNQGDTSSFSPPSIVIRSAAECDEEESSVVASQKITKKNEKTTKTSPRAQKVSELDPMSRTLPPIQNGGLDSRFSSAGVSSLKNVKCSMALQQEQREKEFDSCFGIKHESEDVHNTSCKPVHESVNGRLKAVDKTGVSAKSLRLGDKLSAKVYQKRAHGLVLDMGGGLRGMYRFEANGKRDFEIGEELWVKCSSFSAKGIPVMSLLEDE